MDLPDGMQFSQASLQSYVDCARLFQLRHVRRLRWPAIQAEPVVEYERHLRLGAQLHRLILQHQMGIPGRALSSIVTEPDLRRWWQNYRESRWANLPKARWLELTLVASVGDHRLVARYDVIAIHEDGQALIVDWKTNRRRPRRTWLSDRLQTRVYPYVLVESAEQLGTKTIIAPGQVRMVYWFANFPGAPERFDYTVARHEESDQYLGALVDEIASRLAGCRAGELLPPTDDTGRCRLCTYRSLCERGAEAGWIDEHPTAGELSESDLFDFEIDIEQIAELEVG